MDDVKAIGSAKPRKWLWIGSTVLLAVFILLTVGHFIWLGSGSNEWQLAQEKNGIKIWTQKTPGNPLLKGRAQFKVQSTLGGILKVVYDLDVHKANKMPEFTVLGSARMPGYFSAFNTFEQPMPFPFKAREFMLLSQHLQDPKTHVIELNAMAAPNKTPPSDCCVRLVHVHNRYTLTPVGNGEVEMDFLWDIDMGGAFPYALENAALPGTLYKAMDDFRNLIAKYKNDKLDYITEPSETRVSAYAASLSVE